MPGYAADRVDPKAAFEKRAQEYERIIEGLNQKLAQSERVAKKGLSTIQEAHSIVSAISRIATDSAIAREKDPEGWKTEDYGPKARGGRPAPTMTLLLSVLSTAIQDLESSR